MFMRETMAGKSGAVAGRRGTGMGFSLGHGANSWWRMLSGGLCEI
jgi:hypothetical protein